MANTFSQIYIQIVFSVKSREALIPKNKKEELHKYIAGLVQNKNCKMISVNSVRDHIHIFIGLNPAVSLSNLVKDIKTSTSLKIKKERWCKKKLNGRQVMVHFHMGNHK